MARPFNKGGLQQGWPRRSRETQRRPGGITTCFVLARTVGQFNTWTQLGANVCTSRLAKAHRAAALAALIAGRDVSLLSPDDTPDRYGRQTAIVVLGSTETPVQALLLRQGDALVSAEITNKDCAAELSQAEAEARQEKKGVWADTTVIKNAESSGDILANIGRFAVVEGIVLSVRQSGTTTYLNFGRSWTRGFAATISKRTIPALESAGIAVKSLESRRIRVRGFIEARPGPRIELLRVGQIEILHGN